MVTSFSRDRIIVVTVITITPVLRLVTYGTCYQRSITDGFDPFRYNTVAAIPISHLYTARRPRPTCGTTSD